MITAKNFSVLGVVATVALLLAGCRAEEQGRVLNYEAGVYKGKQDTQLTASQRRSLRNRLGYQAGVGDDGGGGGGKADVRPPIDSKGLRQRGELQKGVQ